MENKKTDPSVVSGLKLEGGHPTSGDPNLVPDTRPKEDPDEIVHEQDEHPTEEEILSSDPDELVHRVDNFKEDHSRKILMIWFTANRKQMIPASVKS